MKITILALSWRDIRFPNMGGAEVYTHEVLKRAVAAGITVTHFAPYSEGLPSEEVIDGVKYLRAGSLIGSVFKARKYYRQHKDEIDFVMDQCNTFRYFTKFWVPWKKRIFFIHQLTREIWFIQSKGLFAKLGYLAETPMLRLNRKDKTFTVSESTKKDLIDVGFNEKNVVVIPEGIPKSLLGIQFDTEYSKNNDFIYVGRYAKYKGIDVAIEAFCIIKKDYPSIKLRLVGKENKDYIDAVLKPICVKHDVDFEKEVIVHGFVSEEEKYLLMKKSLALIFPSNREGWGLTISEAAALGTPSITYDVPGTRDAVDYGDAGYLCKENSVKEVVEYMRSVIEDKKLYDSVRKRAYEFSQKLDFDITGQMFIDTIEKWYEQT